MNTNIIDLEDYLENREAMPDIQSIAGERWFPEETNITEDMTKYWGGDFGVSSECNKLRAVLLHRPGKEVDNLLTLDEQFMNVPGTMPNRLIPRRESGRLHSLPGPRSG